MNGGGGGGGGGGGKPSYIRIISTAKMSTFQDSKSSFVTIGEEEFYWSNIWLSCVH